MDTAGTVNPVSSDWSGSIPLRPTKYARFVYRLGHPVFIRARAVRLRYRVPYISPSVNGHIPQVLVLEKRGKNTRLKKQMRVGLYMV